MDSLPPICPGRWRTSRRASTRARWMSTAGQQVAGRRAQRRGGAHQRCGDDRLAARRCLIPPTDQLRPRRQDLREPASSVSNATRMRRSPTSDSTAGRWRYIRHPSNARLGCGGPIPEPDLVGELGQRLHHPQARRRPPAHATTMETQQERHRNEGCGRPRPAGETADGAGPAPFRPPSCRAWWCGPQALGCRRWLSEAGRSAVAGMTFG